MDQDRGFSVLLEQRPRCVAFLVDLDSADDRLIDAIIDFNIDSWGGRFNPIIPTRNGQVCPDYWRLLKLSDVDVIYSYSELDQETIGRLDQQCGPIYFVRHRTFPSEGSPNYRPHALDDQASVEGLLLRLRELVPGIYRKRQEPSVLAFDFDHTSESRVSSLVRRNFGVSRKAFFLARDEGVNATYPSSVSELDVIGCVERTPNLLLPIKLSTLGARKRQAIITDEEEPFLICYGDHVANAIYYWNRAYFRGLPYLWASGINDMWLGTSSISDLAVYKTLLGLIRRLGSSGGLRRFKIVSSDHDVSELDDLAKRICGEIRTNFYAAQSERIDAGFFPEISAVRPLGPDGTRLAHEFVRGKRFFVPVDRPKDVSGERDKRWMMRLWIENPDQERFFANDEPQWQLPSRQPLARLFAGQHRRCRMSLDGWLDFEVASGEQTCEVTIPEKRTLFSSLLLPRRCYWMSDDLRHSRADRRDEMEIGASEKNKYLSGLLGLFGSVSEATRYFVRPST